MNIHIQWSGHNIRLALPTSLVFHRRILRFALGNIRMDGVTANGLSRQQTDTLSAEIRRIKKKHGTWTLVEVESADGERVTVTL